MPKWLQLVADTRCNQRCQGCFAAGEEGPALSTAEALDTLREARRNGSENLLLGGGEPTLRRDLLALVNEARQLGYARIKLQTNGMMLAYPAFARRALEAGVSEVNFAIKGATAATHDRLTRTPGSFELLLRGIEEWRRLGKPMEGDLLLYRSNLGELSEMVRAFHERGLERFHLWLFSTGDATDARLLVDVPRVTEAAALIAKTVAQDLSAGSRNFLSSRHTPPCTLPPEAADALYFPAELDVLVANPDGRRFKLETSPLEGGVYLERCAGCAMRARCGGLRADYLGLHGDAEFQPLPLAEVPKP